MSQAGSVAHGRYRTNRYLDKANEDMFHPRNLHCMIMTYKPGYETVVDMDVNGSQQDSVSGYPPTSASASKFRVSNGVTAGEWALPICAPLIYPTQTHTTDNQPGFWKSNSKFLARAQAKFAALHGPIPNLSIPGATNATQFVSKWSDRNGKPFEIFGRGKEDGRRRGKGRSNGFEIGHHNTAIEDPNRQSNVSSPKQSRGLLDGLKGIIIEKDVLYLVIAEILM